MPDRNATVSPRPHRGHRYRLQLAAPRRLRAAAARPAAAAQREGHVRARPRHRRAPASSNREGVDARLRQPAALCRAGAGVGVDHLDVDRHRGGARRQRRPRLRRRDRAAMRPAGADPRRRRKRRASRPPACSPAFPMPTASSAISAAAASSWCRSTATASGRSATASRCRSGRCGSPSSGDEPRAVLRTIDAASSATRHGCCARRRQIPLSRRRRVARDRPHAHGAGALSAAHHPPIHGAAPRGGRLSRDRRRACRSARWSGSPRSTASGSKWCRWRR